MAVVDPLSAARARLRQLKAEHDAGKLDDRRYDEARRAVEREIGEGLLAGHDAQAKRPSRGLVGLLSAFVLALAGIGYWQTGSPSLIREAVPVAGTAPTDAAATAGAGGQPALQQIEAMVGKLAERMKANPDDAEG